MFRRSVLLGGSLSVVVLSLVSLMAPHGSVPAGDDGSGSIRLVPSKAVYAPREEIQVEAYLDPSFRLRSYQVALDASGGRSGRLLPTDAQLDATRPDFAFAGASMVPSVNPDRPSVASRLERGAVTLPSPVYLGTFTLRPSPDASGEFRIRVCLSDSAMTDSFGNEIPPGTSEIAITVTEATPDTPFERTGRTADLGRDSGDESRAPLVSAVMVPYGATWKYLDDGSDQGTAWRARTGFGDGGWSAGPAELGYGDGDEATVVSYGLDETNKYITTYFRHTFSVADAADVASLALDVVRDDGVVVYLNGSEVCRNGMPGGTIFYDTLASFHAGGESESTPVSCPAPSPNLLVEGDNVLAVEIHQVAVTSSDISFNLELIAELVGEAPDPPILIWPLDGATDVSVNPELRVHVTDPDEDDLEVTFYGRLADGTTPAEDFTIIHLTDTQYYSRDSSPAFGAITQWVRENQASRNIVFLSMSGDLVNNADQLWQWDNAVAAMSTLEPAIMPDLLDGLPYGVLPGNHDQVPWGNPNGTQNYNMYFGLDRFCPDGTCRSYYGGNFGSDNDNNYQLFSAGGMDFIVINIEFQGDEPPVLDWADDLLQTYSDRRAILASHYLLEVAAWPDESNWSAQGINIYNAVMDRPNLFLMLAGHMHGEGRRINPRTPPLGDVVAMVANYQDVPPNGGNGQIRILEFSPANDEIRVFTYSVTTQTFLTGPDSEFVLPYEMEGGPPFVDLGTVNVPSDSDAFVIWPGLLSQVDYEWRVEVTDGTTATTGPIWTFGTRCSVDSDCDDGDACTYDACIAGGCEYSYDDGASCDDGDLCTTSDQCFEGGCSGTAIVCPDGHTCEPDTGQCVVILEEVVFQDGLDGYAGTQDSFIQEAAPDNVNGASPEFEWDDDDPGGDPVERNFGLLRFDDIIGTEPDRIPPDATVVSAEVTYTVFNYGLPGDLHEAILDWSEADSLTSFCGASCDEGDEYAVAVVDTAEAPSAGTFGVDVTASIQSWLDDPDSNRGWVIVPGDVPTPTGGVNVRSSDYQAAPSVRPKLSVTYHLAPPCVLDIDCDDGEPCTVDTCDQTIGACTSLAPPIPAEVRDLVLSMASPGSTTAVLAWSAEPLAESYNVYRATLDAPDDPVCFLSGVLSDWTEDDGTVPDSGAALAYLATAVNCSGESSLGAGRPNTDPCP